MRSRLWAGWGALLLFTCGGCGDDGSESSSETQFMGTWGTGDLLDGQLASPTCLALDPESGNIYVGDKTAQSRPLIQIFTPQGQFIERWEISYSVGSLEELVFASDGTLYGTDSFGRIVHLGSDGVLLEVWGDEGLAGNSQGFASDLVMGQDDLLYITYPAGHQVRVLDREGNIVRSWGLDTPFYPESIALDASGFIYAAQYNRIYKFTNDGELLKSWETPIYQASTMYPNDLALFENGDVLLIQEGTAVLRFTPDGTPVGSWSGEGPFLDGYASNIETDLARGTVYTLGLRAFGVQVYGDGGELLDTMGEPPSTAPGQFYFPDRIDVIADGSLVVRDGFRIQRFSPEGIYQGSWNLFSVPELFTSAMAVLPGGAIVVGVDEGIRKYSATGDVLAEWNFGRFFRARGMDCDETGRIWVTTNLLPHQVMVLSEDGDVLESWGVFGDAPGELFVPLAIAAREGYVAVCDRKGLQVFSEHGEFFAHLGEMFQRRLAIAGGKLYVSDTGGNVTVFSLSQVRSGLSASPVGKIPHPSGETRPFLLRDVAATPQGDVYVLSPVLGRVFRYRFGTEPPVTPTAPGRPWD